MVTGKKAGTATITATTEDGNKTATCTVTVNDPPVGNERTLKAATITLFAGSDEAGFAEGTGEAAQFNYPMGMCLDGDGNLYVADRDNHRIRKITPTGVVTTILGNGDPLYEAAAHGPGDVLIYDGWIYIVERSGNRIRRMKLGIEGRDPSWPDEINVFAGEGDVRAPGGQAGWAYENGEGTSARFSRPQSITVDDNGNFYVCDFANRVIRKITSEGIVSMYAGPLSVACLYCGNDKDMLSYPGEVCWNPADGNLYVAALNRERVVKITAKDAYSTFVGHIVDVAEDRANEVNNDSYNDGPGTVAEFARPALIKADQSGYMFLGEQSTIHRLRFITPSGIVSTIAAGDGEPLARTNALLPKLPSSPTGIAVTPDGKTLYVAEGSGNKIWKITLEYNNY